MRFDALVYAGLLHRWMSRYGCEAECVLVLVDYERFKSKLRAQTDGI